ncbi:MAG: tRNA lysidine(34) synthetase TilS [Actinomycetota bacterium]|nr:tRNA lysidine(34) synthetase TilS [Actinomycetota bacterium]
MKTLSDERHPLERKVLATIEKYDMLKSGDRVLVAVSGGPDSVALLYILTALCGELGLKLHVFHLNHMMRKESEEDALFVQKLAERLECPSTILSFDVPAYMRKERLSPEEAAREVRYRSLEKVGREIKANRIALGHHADDQVETFLMRLLRGSGQEGLRGMLPVRGEYIRPLIESTRDEIQEYCGEKGIEFRLDLSNLDTSYLRNKVRHQLIPALERYNPNFKGVILKTMEILSEEQDLLDEIAEEKFNEVAVIEKDLVKLSCKRIQKLPLAIQRRVLRRGIQLVKGNLRGIEFKHLEGILGYVSGKLPHLQMDLPGRLVALSECDALIITFKEKLKVPKVPRVLLNIPGVIDIPSLGIRIRAEFKDAKGEIILKEDKKAYLDADKLKPPLILRTRIPGDSFRPLGMEGEKKLQDFFVDEKVPRRLRDRIPILQGKDHILWVIGYRIDDRAKVNRGTKTILKLEVEDLE